MKAIVHPWRTEIFPTIDEVKALCRPGEEANTCVWLVVGAGGFECLFHNKPSLLYDRWVAGETHAKRNGCDRVRDFSPLGLSGEVEMHP
jgi:hypothetical protein